MRFRGLFLSAASVLSLTASAQLVVDESMTPEQLVQNVLLGGGVSISNITFNGGAAATLEEQAGSFEAPAGSNLGLVTGVILSTGRVASDPDNFVYGANGSVDDFASSLLQGISDPDLAELSGQEINDAAVLEFDFVPTGDSLKFRYVFGSEEYPGFTCTDFNDAFGFFLSGPGIAGPFSNGAVNIALVPNTNVPVSINTLNGGVPTGGGEASTCAAFDPNWEANSVYFVDNAAQTGTIVTYDGFTVVLTAFALVQCGEEYHIKLAIGDGFDESYDSGVFLEGGSFTSTGQVIPELVSGPGIIGNTMYEGCVPVELVFTRQGDVSLSESVDIVVSGSATPGVDYGPALPTEITFAEEDSTVAFVLDIPLDADGPEDVVITISQLIVCANQNVETVFEFVIDSPLPLSTNMPAVINAACGDVHVLDPQVSGGVGYYGYAWSTGETTPTIVVSPDVTTVYDYTITDGCSVEPISGSVTVVLPVYGPLEIVVSPDIQIPCLEEDQISVTSAAGGNGVYTYEWNRGSTAVGNTATVTVPASEPTYYVVTVSEGCGQVVEDSVLVSTVPMDPIVVTPSEDVTVVCAGDTAQLSVLDITGGNGVYTVAWTNSSEQALSSAYDIEVAVPADEVYTITAEDQCGYTGEAQVRTWLPHYDPFYITTNDDHVICFGDSSNVEVDVFGGSGYYSIEWIERGWTDPILKVIPTEENTYVVKVTDRCGDVRIDEVVVEVEAVYMDIVQENLGQDDWHLKAATVPQGFNHKWEMGDGSLYRTNEVFHSYTDLEDHWVTLTMTTANGCVGTDSVELKVPAHIYFPTAFSPDGDGLNDTFGPTGHYIDEFELLVFNRWGEQIYSTDNVGMPWTGDVNGGDAADTGVYVYRYKAKGHYFPATEGYGSVTLLKGTQD